MQQDVRGEIYRDFHERDRPNRSLYEHMTTLTHVYRFHWIDKALALRADAARASQPERGFFHGIGLWLKAPLPLANHLIILGFANL